MQVSKFGLHFGTIHRISNAHYTAINAAIERGKPKPKNLIETMYRDTRELEDYPELVGKLLGVSLKNREEYRFFDSPISKTKMRYFFTGKEDVDIFDHSEILDDFKTVVEMNHSENPDSVQRLYDALDQKFETLLVSMQANGSKLNTISLSKIIKAKIQLLFTKSK